MRQLRLTTLQYVDVLKCITYAFMLGQRLAHQPGSGWASDIVLTLLTSIALPGFIMACLEARSRHHPSKWQKRAGRGVTG